uniref:ribosomal protein L7/L12 n=1 Tax=Flavobacterium sp. TaxID=239 RepID=UPI00404A2532
MDFKKYFQPYDDYFWKPTFNAIDVVTHDFVFEQIDGSTIAYGNYVVEVLDLLSDVSIPPFGSLLLAISATNPNGAATLDSLHKFAKSKEIVSSFPNNNLYRTGAAIDFLKLLASLPEPLKTGGNRILLFKTIFEKCPNRVGSEVAKRIIRDFKNEPAEYFYANNSIAFNEANFVKDFRTIALLKHTFPTKESILKALDALPDDEIDSGLEAVVSQPLESKKSIDFVEELVQEQQTFHVGSLIQRIWSGLNIPFHHNVPSQQPIGGVSDLTNKGDFDKLLLSEFANDDMVFMSRLANNEALYIQREIPPQDNKKIRILLLDVSLKNWGNPKIVAFATALAIAKHPKTDIECLLYVYGNQYVPVKINSVTEVGKSLQQLSTDLDGSEGLQKFFNDEFQMFKDVELFLLTQEESFESINFAKVVNEHFDKINFIITTDASGIIDTFKIKNKTRNFIKRIQLPLEELWRKKPVFQTRVFKAKNQGEVPILFPVERSYKNIFHFEDAFYLYTNTNLFIFNDEEPMSKGFTKFASNIPFTMGQFTLFRDKKDHLFLVNWIEEDKSLHYYDLKEKTTTTKGISINSDQDLKLFSKDQSLYFYDNYMCYEINDNHDCIVTTNQELKDYYESYWMDNDQFVSGFKYTKAYGVIKRCQKIQIDITQKLHINRYYLNDDLFLKYRQSSLDKFLDFEPIARLILKRAGNQKIAVINFIKTNFNFGLKECKEIVDESNSEIVANLTQNEAFKFKTALEDLGAICYIETTHFLSKDGSSISNNNGILVLESSNSDIPKMYIPLVMGIPTAFATDAVFAGNQHFAPTNILLNNIELDDFINQYYNPFIKHILDHEASFTTT